MGSTRKFCTRLTMSKTILLVFIIAASFFDVIVSDCKQSYVTICDTIEDLKNYPEIYRLTNVIVGSDHAAMKSNSLNLNYLLLHLSNNVKLSTLVIVGVLNKLVAIEGYCTISNSRLKDITLYGNTIESIEPSQFPHMSLKKLHLINNKIKNVLPRSLAYIKVEEVDLSDNLIEAIEGDVFNTYDNRTKIISIRNNNLAHIAPGSFPSSLQFLHLDNNKLRFIQAEVFQYMNLKQLTLSHNKLTSLPEIDMDKLEFLDVSSNAIKLIKNEPILNLKSLKYLDLSNNSIRDSYILEKLTSPGIQKLAISLAYNKLTDLNCSTVSLEKKELVLYGNPFDCKISDGLKKTISGHESLCDQTVWSEGSTPYCLNYAYADVYHLEKDLNKFYETVRNNLHHCDFPPYYFTKLYSIDAGCIL